MNIREVFDTRTIYRYEDISEEEKKRLNKFFKENYNFEFKDIHSKSFEVQLKGALMATSRSDNVVIYIARRVLNARKKYYDKWSEVINFY